MSAVAAQRSGNATPALEMRGLRKSFGAAEIIRGVDLTIPTGERHAVIGPNGAGKSTLFNLISGLLVPSAGEIRLDGAPINGCRPTASTDAGSRAPSRSPTSSPDLSVWENVRCAVLWSKGEKYTFWRRARRQPGGRRTHPEVLTEINLISRKDLPAGVLTYAEQRALEIGITMAGGARVILLDEPTAGMSHAETERAVDLIRRISEGRTLGHRRARHERGLRAGRPHLGAGLRRDHCQRQPAEIRGNAKVREAYLGEEAH